MNIIKKIKHKITRAFVKKHIEELGIEITVDASEVKHCVTEVTECVQRLIDLGVKVTQVDGPVTRKLKP